MATGTKPNYDARIITNNVTGETATWLERSCESNGKHTRFSMVCKPGGGPPTHFHRTYTERFTASKGCLTLVHNGVTKNLQPGDSALIEIGDTHTFTNGTAKDIEFEVEFKPGQPGLEKGLAIVFGLANDGYTDSTGVPRNPIYLALFSSSKMSDIQLAGVSGMIINPALETLASYGRWMGWEKYLIDKYCPDY